VTPSAWQFVLLALAAFRAWKLVGDDAVLDRPRDWLLDRLGGEASDRGDRASYLMSCPWCLGAWMALAWWLAWLAWPHGAVVVATPFALSAAVGYLGVTIDRLED
jgi:hypothetical protein